MDLKAFYKQIGANSDEVIRRLGSETLIIKYLGKFCDDDSYNDLKLSLSNNDYEHAFRAAHTIKGICLNLELTPLTEISIELAEVLRDYTDEKKERLEAAYQKFITVYNDVIKHYKESI